MRLPVGLLVPILAWSWGAPSPLAAQDTTAGVDALRVFLDCQRCDFDHMRREVPVVNYVRDQVDAHVHVLVTFEETGAGGDEWTFHFLGRNELGALADTLRYVTQQIQTSDEIRDGYTLTFALGLVRYLTYTGRAAGIDLEFPDDFGAQQAQPGDDPWNLWVFRASISGEFAGETRRQDTSLDGSLSASRTTEDFKIDFGVDGDYEKEEVELSDGGREIFDVADFSGGGTAVWSLGPHWSAGFSAEAGLDESVNQSFYARAAPALEYSFYPYAESTRRQITATYRVGAVTYQYYEETLFGKMEETRPEHSLELSADFVQPWGDLLVSIEGSHLLDDPSKHRIDVFSNLEFRIYRGLSLDVRGGVARVRDQIYLSAEGLDDDEILVGQREIGTEFEYEVEVGLSFTFGSVFNNIVNPRLRSGGDFDGDFN
jgi:hypothetical protein